MSHQVQRSEVPLHPGELQVLDTAIGSYLEYLQQLVEPSKERTKLLNILHAFRLRLQSTLQGHREGARLWLTGMEVQAIDRAVLTFCRLVPLVAEPSPERDKTLQELQKVRVRISGLLSSPLD